MVIETRKERTRRIIAERIAAPPRFISGSPSGNGIIIKRPSTGETFGSVEEFKKSQRGRIGGGGRRSRAETERLRLEFERKSKEIAEEQSRQVKIQADARTETLRQDAALREQQRIETERRNIILQGGRVTTKTSRDVKTGRELIITETRLGGRKIRDVQDVEMGTTKTTTFAPGRGGGSVRRTGGITVKEVRPVEEVVRGVVKPSVISPTFFIGEVQPAPERGFFGDILSFFTREKTKGPLRQVISSERVKGGIVESRLIENKDGIPSTFLIFIPSDGSSERTPTQKQEKEFRDKQIKVTGITRPEDLLRGIAFDVSTKQKIIETQRIRGEGAKGFKRIFEDIFVGGIGAGAATSLIGSAQFTQAVVTDPVETAIGVKQSVIQLAGDVVSGKTIRDIALTVKTIPGFALGFAGAEIGTGILAGKFVSKVPRFTKATIRRAKGIIQFPDITDAFSKSRGIRGLDTVINIDDILKSRREFISEATVRIVERKGGFKFESIEREIIKAEIKGKLKPDIPTKPRPITFQVTKDLPVIKALEEKALRLTRGQDLLVITESGGFRTVKKVPRFKKPKPKQITFGLDPNDLTLRQALEEKALKLRIKDVPTTPTKPKPLTFEITKDLPAVQALEERVLRLTSGQDLIKITKKGTLKAIEKVPRFKKPKPKQITFGLDPNDLTLRQALEEKALKLRIKDVQTIGKGGQVSIIEVKQIQKAIPKLEILPQKITEIQKLSLKRITDENIKTVQKIKQLTKPIQLSKIIQENILDQDFGTLQLQATEVKLRQPQKLKTVQVQEVEQIQGQLFLPILKTRPRTKVRTIQVFKQETVQDFASDFTQAQTLKQDFAQAQDFGTSQLQRVRSRLRLPVSPIPQDLVKPIPSPFALRRKRLQERIKEVELFTLEIKERGVFRPLGGDLTLRGALGLGSRETRKTLARTFRIRRTGRRKKIRADEDFGEPDLTGFRRFKIKGGRRIDTPFTFIQEKQFALGSRSERRLLQESRQQAVQLNEILNM